MTLVRSLRHELACNWKTYADNYLEGYHIPLLHPELNRQFDAKRYRVELGDRYCRHTAPARDGSPVDGRWLFRWPNLALNIYGDSMNVEVIVPTGPESCTVSYSHFFVDPDAADVAEVIALADTVMEQDRRMVESVQRNLAAGMLRRRPAQPASRERGPAVPGPRTRGRRLVARGVGVDVGRDRARRMTVAIRYVAGLCSVAVSSLLTWGDDGEQAAWQGQS